uniref:Uncharacterized protein n=1 Tax=Arundo donax TaxID=35708 RepID=A0A0A9C7R6_ARUDO
MLNGRLHDACCLCVSWAAYKIVLELVDGRKHTLEYGNWAVDTWNKTGSLVVQVGLHYTLGFLRSMPA